MKIGSLQLEDITVLAPLAGITNLPFRLMIKAAGCALVCSEMVSANGLVHNSRKTRQLLNSTPEEKPLSVQLFGSDPAMMADAAAMVAAAGANILDINFGCSVKKILKSGSGSALMREPGKARQILRSVRQAIDIPLTIKVRSGWDASGRQAIHLAQIAEECGVDAVAVHPRTATQGFRGTADWPIIKAVKNRVGLPVIGNGDITTGEDALAMLDETGCDGIMIGRAALTNPWIFSQVSAMVRAKPVPTVDTAMHFDAMIGYLKSSVTYFGELHACRMMRSRLGWFTKGLRFSSRFRDALKSISTEAEAIDLIRSYEDALKQHADQTHWARPQKDIAALDCY